MNEQVRLQAWKDQLSQDEFELVQRLEGLSAEQQIQVVAVNARRDLADALAEIERSQERQAQQHREMLEAMEQRMRDEIKMMRTPIWKAAATSGGTFFLGALVTVATVVSEVHQWRPG